MQLAHKLGSMFEHSGLGLLAVVIKQTEVKTAGLNMHLYMCVHTGAFAAHICMQYTDGIDKFCPSFMFNVSNWYSVHFILSRCFIREKLLEYF